VRGQADSSTNSAAKHTHQGRSCLEAQRADNRDCCLDYLNCESIVFGARRSTLSVLVGLSHRAGHRQRDFESVHLERNCCASSRHPTIVCSRTLQGSRETDSLCRKLMTSRTAVAGGRLATVLGAQRPQQVNLCSLHRAFSNGASRPTCARSPCLTRYTETSVPHPALSIIALDQPVKVQSSYAHKLS